MKDTGVNLAAQERLPTDPAAEAGPEAPSPASPPKKRRSRIWPIFLIIVLALLAGVAWFVMREVRTSALQAELRTQLGVGDVARQLTPHDGAAVLHVAPVRLRPGTAAAELGRAVAGGIAGGAPRRGGEAK